MASPAEGLAAQSQYDVITCLSVTKWVHLSQGDEGLLALFRKVYALLRPGGRFLLEPQPWKSYKKRKYVSEEAKQHFAAIKIRPDAFAETLRTVIGFAEVQDLGYPEGASKGFRRPILCCLKADPT